ncbi:hypothetical protein AU476_02055 [Cupriavidus sp. UYMSc13B]|nr:hypothetical protein AU476_02055 [Cupriavidus sp. UYMSc13B]
MAGSCTFTVRSVSRGPRKVIRRLAGSTLVICAVTVVVISRMMPGLPPSAARVVRSTDSASAGGLAVDGLKRGDQRGATRHGEDVALADLAKVADFVATDQFDHVAARALDQHGPWIRDRYRRSAADDRFFGHADRRRRALGVGTAGGERGGGEGCGEQAGRLANHWLSLTYL